MANQFTDHCLELLAPLGVPRAKRMFGGHGLYVDDLFIALIAHDRLYLKVDDTTRSRFETAGSDAFTYGTRDGQRVSLSYYSAPEEAMESPALMQPWARLALQTALAAAALRPARSTRNSAPRRVSKQASPPDGKVAAKRRTKSAA